MIYIGMGGNISFGSQPVMTTLRAALEVMPDVGIRIRRCSSFYHSRPVPVSDQPWFYNAVFSCSTHLAPHELLRALLWIEEKFGRVRPDRAQPKGQAIKNAARTLDLDILDMDGHMVLDDSLILPHPRLTTRAFILLPLLEIAPDWIHPVTGQSVKDLVHMLCAEDIAHTVRVG